MTCISGANIVEDGLVLHLDAANSRSYSGTGTIWKDLSGNSNNGTLVNGVGYSSDNNGAMVFDGVDESISIPETTDLNNLSYTYAFWIRRKVGFVASFLQFLQRSTSNRNPGIWLYQNSDNRIHFSIHLSSGVNTSVDPFGFFQNEWHYFTATVDYNGTDTVMKSYIDAVNTQTRTISGVSPLLGTGSSYVGKQLIDLANLQIYNRALTPEEVKQNFEATRGRYGI
jgi:hypothetical protein